MKTSLLAAALAKSANPTIDALIPENKDRGPFHGIVSDALLLPEGYRRSGRLNALQEAQGLDSPRELSHPNTARALSWLKGMGIGGGVGAFAGAGLGGMLEAADKPGGGRPVEGILTGGGIGAMAGVGVGSIVGAIMGIVKHRRAQTEATEQLRASGGEGANVHNIQKGSPWAGLVSGMHQTGKADTAEALATGKRRFDKQPWMTAMQLAQNTPYVGPIAGLGLAAGSAVRYNQAGGRLSNAQERRLMPTM